MSASNGLRVEKIRLGDGTPLMKITTPPKGSYPAFKDWFDMIQILCECEVEKYGGDPSDPNDWECWTQMPREFLDRCFAFREERRKLLDEFEVPRREGVGRAIGPQL